MLTLLLGCGGPQALPAGPADATPHAKLDVWLDLSDSGTAMEDGSRKQADVINTSRLDVTVAVHDVSTLTAAVRVARADAWGITPLLADKAPMPCKLVPCLVFTDAAGHAQQWDGFVTADTLMSSVRNE